MSEDWRGHWPVGELQFHETAASTNDIAAQMAANGAPHLSIAIADEQTHGRGRSGSTWQAPPKSSLLFSVVLRMPEQGTAPGCAPIRVGLAVARVVEDASSVRTRVKWPNDVVIEEHGKVAGVLCEGSFTSSGGYIIAGIGINVTQGAADFGELQSQACSIKSASGATVDRAELLGGVFSALRELGTSLTEPLTEPEIDELNRRDILLGNEIEVQIGTEMLRGRALGIKSNGALRLALNDGAIREVLNGTVRMATRQYPGT
ncbi:MAG TPA: biotin--[acetyl-CoA-carboxylase] ligase [Longimicrobiales bacterium]|nr:biotin--[acetyl-CoA-carboxylase] ligase [Longimicrobiales bacterium]